MREDSGPEDGEIEDADTDTVDTGRASPIHLNWRYLVMVFVGGAVGTAVREGLVLVIPNLGGIPLAIFVINVFGAFLLGLLLEALSRGGPDEGRRRSLRLLLGTGFLGGFTTYSTLATGTTLLAVEGSNGLAIAYSLATVVLGAAASWGGIAAGASIHRRRQLSRSGIENGETK
jgi:CrcB protein